MTDSSKKENKQLAVYANQWRFRSTRGLTRNSNYYYNTGSLDGNMILSQFIDVLTSYEILGVQVLGIVSDGGGSNTKFSILCLLNRSSMDHGQLKIVYVLSILLTCVK